MPQPATTPPLPNATDVELVENEPRRCRRFECDSEVEDEDEDEDDDYCSRACRDANLGTRSDRER